MNFDLMKASRRLSELELKITTENLEMDVSWFRIMTMEKSSVILRHTHATYEFHFITSGNFRVVLDDGEFDVCAGGFYLTAPGVYHEQRIIGEGPHAEYCINCDLRLTEEKPSEMSYILKVLQETPCMGVQDSHGAVELFNRALAEAYYQNIGFYNNIKSLALMIVLAAARAISENTSVKYSVPLKEKKDDYRLIQIIKFIEDNISTPVSTKDIARFMFLSDKQICRIIEDKMGMTTKELIISIKHQKAKEFLKRSDFSIKQISGLLGFSSEYYFNQFFKRIEGYPPGIFRENIRRV